MWIIALLVFLEIILDLHNCFRLAFYRKYFDQKQENQGRDPRQVLKQIFPRTWWFIR